MFINSEILVTRIEYKNNRPVDLDLTYQYFSILIVTYI